MTININKAIEALDDATIAVEGALQGKERRIASAYLLIINNYLKTLVETST